MTEMSNAERLERLEAIVADLAQRVFPNRSWKHLLPPEPEPEPEAAKGKGKGR